MALHQIAESTSQIDHLIQLAKEFQFDSFEIPESANDLVKVRPSNLRKVLLECLSIARTTATLKPFLSQVQIARATGLSTKTVMHALRYLEALGWISTINKRDQHATQYELSIHILKL
jgi:Fe2+ or Zn2+ uptake regulation protein